MMAARAMKRRLASLLLLRNDEASNCGSSLLHIPPRQFFSPIISTVVKRFAFHEKGIQTQASATSHGVDGEDREGNSSKPSPDSDNVPSCVNISGDTAMKVFDRSNLKVSSRHDLAMIFTCKVCETRSVKTLCRASYEKGVVVARCSGCNNLHLIADHLGWFGEPGSVEDYLAARGEEVKRGSVDTLNLTLEDIAGKK